MGHGSYEDAKKLVWKGCVVLAVITLIEVGVSLFGKGHLGWDPSSVGTLDFHVPLLDFDVSMNPLLAVVGFLLIALSAYKAYYIIYNFMHMAHEVPGLRMSVLLPVFLLLWGMIAFFQEGGAWGERRAVIKKRDKMESEKSIKPIGMLFEKEQKIFTIK